MKKWWLGLLFAPALAFGQVCPGPGPCIPEKSAPEGTVLCIQGVCSPVVYQWIGSKVVAESTLPNGYEVLGWSGPCLNEDRAACPDIFNQAIDDLRNNALRSIRAQNFVE